MTERTPERSLVLVKPDGVRRGLTGEVIRRVEAKGYSLVALELRTATRDGTGDYAIYTNIDIALQPHFYTALDAMIRKLPPDQQMTFAGTINRRTIGDDTTARRRHQPQPSAAASALFRRARPARGRPARRQTP